MHASSQVLDQRLHLAFKKANKKDSTTKLKALSELSECFVSIDAETVVSSLSHWVCTLSGIQAIKQSQLAQWVNRDASMCTTDAHVQQALDGQ